MSCRVWQRVEASTKLIKMRADETRALVTGGAGFIGSHVVEHLVADGARVTVVDDLSSGCLDNLGSVMARIDFDDRPLGALLAEPALVLDYDVIFHLAANAYIPPSVEDPAFDFGLNLETTFRLLEVLRTAERRPRLVNTSSAAVYGDPQRLPIHESDPTVPISPYGVGKLSAERYVAVYSQLYGIAASSVRLFSVYGPRQRKQVVYDLIDRLARDPSRLDVIGDGTQERDFAYVEDVAAAMVLVSRQAPGAGEVFNVASGSTHSIAQLVVCYLRGDGARPRDRVHGKGPSRRRRALVGRHERAGRARLRARHVPRRRTPGDVGLVPCRARLSHRCASRSTTS